MRLLRRIRGIVGTALTWATGWGVLGAAANAVALLVWGVPRGAPVAYMLSMAALFLATYGFIAGVASSLVLLAAERRHARHQLTLPRMAAWGGLGGVLMAAVPVAAMGLTSLTGVFLLVCGLLGTGSAAASLSIARRGQIAGATDHTLEPRGAADDEEAAGPDRP